MPDVSPTSSWHRSRRDITPIETQLVKANRWLKIERRHRPADTANLIRRSCETQLFHMLTPPLMSPIKKFKKRIAYVINSLYFGLSGAIRFIKYRAGSRTSSSNGRWSLHLYMFCVLAGVRFSLWGSYLKVPRMLCREIKLFTARVFPFCGTSEPQIFSYCDSQKQFSTVDSHTIFARSLRRFSVVV